MTKTILYFNLRLLVHLLREIHLMISLNGKMLQMMKYGVVLPFRFEWEYAIHPITPQTIHFDDSNEEILNNFSKLVTFQKIFDEGF